MPISRFLEFLLETGNYEAYMERLANAFNPAAADGLMCRYTISVGWDGTLYDCDFNQMLELPANHGAPQTLDGPARRGRAGVAPGGHGSPLLRLHRGRRILLRRRRCALEGLLQGVRPFQPDRIG